MEANIRHLIDFKKVDSLLEGFSKTTGFVTAILDLEGNVLSKSGWRQMCTEFHRMNPETSKKCTISDTELANKIGEGEKYHFYKCLNGLVDVAVPIIINGEHIANLFSGQFFFEEPDTTFFKKQAEKYGFDEGKYLAALKNVPVVSRERVKTAMDFLLNMTQMISETTFQKLEHIEHTKNLRESEEKAKENEEKYRAMYNSAPLSYQSLDENGCFIDINPMWIKTLGYERDEVIGKWYGDFLHPDYVEHFRRNFPAFKKRGNVSDVQFKLRRKDNTYIHVSFEGCVGYTPEGKFKQTYCVFKDITEQKALENAIINAKEKAEESASKLKAALDSMSDAVFISDKDGNFLDFNDAFATFHKFKNKQECAKTFKEYPLFLDVYFPNGALAPIEQWVVPSALRGEMGINKEFTLLRRDTNETWIGSYNYAPIRNIEGHIIGSVVACRDITDSKKAQFELIAAKEKAEESEKRFDLAMKASNDGLFDWNLETNEIYYSPSWKKMLGYEDNELPNDFTVWEKTTEPEDVKKSWELQQKLITKQIDRFVMEFKMKHKDGQWVDILSRAQAIFNDSGKAIRIVGIHTNITERKRSEILLHEQTEEIAAQNEELNATNLQLIASISKAEESEEKFRLLHENAGLGIGYYSPDGIVLSYNQIAAKNMDGIPEDFIGKSIFDLFPKQSADLFFNRIQNAIIASQSTVYEDLVQLPKEDKWFMSTYTKIENSSYDILGIQIISQDVTKIKLTEIELQKAMEMAEESERRFRKSLEFSPLPIAVANNNGDLLFANKQFIEAFGYSLEELGSIPKLFELAYPDIEYRNSRLTLWSGDVEFAIRNSVPTPVRESFITCKNGSVKTVEISVSIEKEISIGLFQDITERKQAEYALMAKMDELERFHKLTVGRELTMVELKKEVNNLLNKLGQGNKYNIVE